MIVAKDIRADLHVHTIASMHAYSTLKECIDAAEKNGMKYLAITDHYYNDGTELNKKNEVNYIAYLEKNTKNTRADVTVIGGAEFNIAQEIASWRKLENLRWKLIGVHGSFLKLKETTLEELYHYFEDASDKFTAFAHIERQIHKIDKCCYGNELTEEVRVFLSKIVLLAKEKHIILEVNESSLVPDEKGTYERLEYWVKEAKKNGNIISLGTDSHYCEDVGRFDRTIDLLNKIDFPKENILNCNEEMLKELFVW